MNERTILQKVVQQFFVIFTLYMLAAAAYCKVFYPDNVFSVRDIISFMVQALIADLPVLVFYSRKELSQKQWIIRYVLHFLLLEGVLVGIGIYNSYIKTLPQAIVFVVIVGITYVLVRFSCYLMDLRTANELNAKFKERQKERPQG